MTASVPMATPDRGTKAGSATKAGAAAQATPARAGVVHLSEAAARLRQPEGVSEAVLDGLRTAIEAGTYEVDVDRLADRLLDTEPL